MVEIRKGKLKNKVTLTAYNNYYKNAGWLMVVADDGGKSNVDEERLFKDSGEDDNGEEWDEVINSNSSSKPLSEMSKSELEEYAASLNVDIKGLTKVSQIRDAIVAAM